eukprot:gene3719-7389_t
MCVLRFKKGTLFYITLNVFIYREDLYHRTMIAQTGTKINPKEKATVSLVKQEKKSTKLPERNTADYYGYGCGILLCPFFLLFFILTYVGNIPILLLVASYSFCVHRPTAVIQRNCWFYLLSTLCFVVNAPVFFIVSMNVCMMSVLSVILCLPYGLVITGFPQIYQNYKALWPFYSIGTYSWFDIICVLIGARDRQNSGDLDFLWSYTVMLTFDPFIKWFLITNPYLHKLDERFTNQYTQDLTNLSMATLYNGLKVNVSDAILVERLRSDVDEDVFTAHYQIPPSSRQIQNIPTVSFQAPSAMGYQFTNTISHFTCSYHPPKDKFKPRSATGDTLVYSVVLYYLNPFHFLTGYVEVNLQPSHALEHPMWCIHGEHYTAALIYQSVNTLFFQYAPMVSEFEENALGFNA